jgi:methylmalonyl-coA decarboxylase, gamma subunit
VVTKVLVSAGQAVKKGDTVVVLEAMKMENNITAECDGKVTGVCVAAGDSVLEGTTLVTIG